MEKQEHFDVRTVNRTLLREIGEVQIDPKLPQKERIQQYKQQIGNPYCYLDQGIVVSLRFADTEVSLQERLEAYGSGLL